MIRPNKIEAREVSQNSRSEISMNRDWSKEKERY